MEPVQVHALYDVGDTIYVPYEGGKHYSARVRSHSTLCSGTAQRARRATEKSVLKGALLSIVVSKGQFSCVFLHHRRFMVQVAKKELRKYAHADGTQRPMWHYLVHYMVSTLHSHWCSLPLPPVFACIQLVFGPGLEQEVR